jgi:hypothetical protein
MQTRLPLLFRTALWAGQLCGQMIRYGLSPIMLKEIETVFRFGILQGAKGNGQSKEELAQALGASRKTIYNAEYEYQSLFLNSVSEDDLKYRILLDLDTDPHQRGRSIKWLYEKYINNTRGSDEATRDYDKRINMARLRIKYIVEKWIEAGKVIETRSNHSDIRYWAPDATLPTNDSAAEKVALEEFISISGNIIVANVEQVEWKKNNGSIAYNWSLNLGDDSVSEWAREELRDCARQFSERMDTIRNYHAEHQSTDSRSYTTVYYTLGRMSLEANEGEIDETV